MIRHPQAVDRLPRLPIRIGAVVILAATVWGTPNADAQHVRRPLQGQARQSVPVRQTSRVAPSTRVAPSPQSRSVAPAAYAAGPEYVLSDSTDLMPQVVTGNPLDGFATGCDQCGFSGTCSSCQSNCCNWATFDYLLWWQQGTQLPTLVTTSPLTTPRDDAGVDGLPSTRTLFGDQRVDNNPLSGGRVRLGHWLDPCHQRAWYVEYLGLQQQEVGFSADSGDFPILARPFFNVVTDEEDALLLGFPDEIDGMIGISSKSRFQGFAAMLRANRCQTGDALVDSALGYRFFEVNESLLINNQLRFIDPNGNTAVGTTIVQTDMFETENQFHGAELGMDGRAVLGCWYLDLGAHVALGNMQRSISISGQSVTSVPGGTPTTTSGGLLTQNSNIGTLSDDKFTAVPQFNAALGWYISPRVNFTVGYTFLYLSNVWRPGDQVDRRVDLSQQTGSTGTLPSLSPRDTQIWLQGLNLGLEMNF